MSSGRICIGSKHLPGTGTGKPRSPALLHQYGAGAGRAPEYGGSATTRRHPRSQQEILPGLGHDAPDPLPLFPGGMVQFQSISRTPSRQGEYACQRPTICLLTACLPSSLRLCLRPTLLPQQLPELLLDDEGWTSPRWTFTLLQPRASGLHPDKLTGQASTDTCHFAVHSGSCPLSRVRNVIMTSLAQEGIAPATIWTYLAAVRHAKVMWGHPEPRESSPLPHLHLVQSGVRRERPPAGLPPSYKERLLWAAAAVCFFGFFRAGEITAPSASAFDPRVHLAWGDVSISGNNQVLHVFLKRSKTDQYGRGTEVFIGATRDKLWPCGRTSPVAVSSRGRFSVHRMAVHSLKPASLSWYGRHWLGQGYPSPGTPGIASGSAPQLPPPKRESQTRPLVEPSFLVLHPSPPGAPTAVL